MMAYAWNQSRRDLHHTIHFSKVQTEPSHVVKKLYNKYNEIQKKSFPSNQLLFKSKQDIMDRDK